MKTLALTKTLAPIKTRAPMKNNSTEILCRQWWVGAEMGASSEAAQTAEISLKASSYHNPLTPGSTCERP